MMIKKYEKPRLSIQWLEDEDSVRTSNGFIDENEDECWTGNF